MELFKIDNTISKIENDEIGTIINDFFSKLIYHFTDNQDKVTFIINERDIKFLFAFLFKKYIDRFVPNRPILQEWDRLKKDKWNDQISKVDFICNYQNLIIFVDIKLSKDSLKTNLISNSTIEDWKYMNTLQIENIKQSAKIKLQDKFKAIYLPIQIIAIKRPPRRRVGMYDENTEQNETITSLRRMGLNPIVNKSHIDDTFSIKNYDELLLFQKMHFEKLNPNPNWSSIWYIKNENSITNKNDDDNYSTLFLLSHVTNIII